MNLKQHTKSSADIIMQTPLVFRTGEETLADARNVLWVSLEGLKKELKREIEKIDKEEEYIDDRVLRLKQLLDHFIDELILLEKEKKED